MNQRIATKRYVEQNWNIKEKEIFSKYAYPLSNEVYLLWMITPAAGLRKITVVMQTQVTTV
ncbi:MAG: hypothetical protein WDM90_18735, partial [Ferruginibacter sp.]